MPPSKQEEMLVVHLDSIWMLSPENYREFLRLVAAGREWDLDELGKQLTDRLIYAGDMTASQAKRLLQEFGRPKGSKADESE